MYNAQDFARDTDVSRETLALYEKWESLLGAWNKSINLVQRTALEAFWDRHALDSHQVVKFLPQDAKTVLDLGSGAGFPGVSIAIALRETAGAQVTLVDSVGKKGTFLRTVKRELSLPIIVSTERAESLDLPPQDVISARAFAPLPKLLDYALPFWGDNTTGIFLKGRGADGEIAAAREAFDFTVDKHESVTDSDSAVVIIKSLSRISKAGQSCAL